MPTTTSRPDSGANHPEGDGRQNQSVAYEIFKYIVGFLGFLLLLYILWYFRSIITYIVVAAVLALILTPIKQFIKKIKIGKKGLGDTIPTILTIVIFLTIISLYVAQFIPLILDQASIVSNINYDQINEGLEEPISRINEFAERYQLQENQDQTFVEGVLDQVKSFLNGTRIFDWLNSILGFTTNILINTFSVLFVLFFFLRDENMIGRLASSVTPDRYEQHVTNLLDKVNFYLKRYFLGIVLQLTIITAVVTIGMLILGVKNALLIGFFAGIVNLIPYVGPLIGAMFGLYVGITSNLNLDFYTQLLPLSGGIVAVFLIAQALDNIFLQPVIQSNAVRAHPLEIFVVILAAAKLGGAVGMIIAIPTYTILRVFAKEFLSEFKIVRSLTQNI